MENWQEWNADRETLLGVIEGEMARKQGRSGDPAQLMPPPPPVTRHPTVPSSTTTSSAQVREGQERREYMGWAYSPDRGREVESCQMVYVKAGDVMSLQMKTLLSSRTSAGPTAFSFVSLADAALPGLIFSIPPASVEYTLRKALEVEETFAMTATPLPKGPVSGKVEGGMGAVGGQEADQVAHIAATLQPPPEQEEEPEKEREEGQGAFFAGLDQTAGNVGQEIFDPPPQYAFTSTPPSGSETGGFGESTMSGEGGWGSSDGMGYQQPPGGEEEMDSESQEQDAPLPLPSVLMAHPAVSDARAREMGLLSPTMMGPVADVPPPTLLQEDEEVEEDYSQTSTLPVGGEEGKEGEGNTTEEYDPEEGATQASPGSFAHLAQKLELQKGAQGESSSGTGLLYKGESTATGLQSGEWALCLAPSGGGRPLTPASGSSGVSGVKIGEVHISSPAMSAESEQCTDSARPDQSDPQKSEEGDGEDEV